MLVGPGVAATGGLATLGPAISASGSPHSPHDWIYEDGLVKESFGRSENFLDGFLMDFCWD